MSRKYTNTAELVRLSGLSRERVQQYLDAGRIAGAYLEPHGTRGVWRIPVESADAWLKARGVKVKRWVQSDASVAVLEAARQALHDAEQAVIWTAG